MEWLDAWVHAEQTLLKQFGGSRHRYNLALQLVWLMVGGEKGKVLAFRLCSSTFELFPMAWEG